MPSFPPASGPQPPELRSLATIAVALLTCQHPETGRVSANVIVTAQAVRITWCSFCGAIAADEGSGDVWQRCTFASLLSTAHLGELSLVLHAIRRLSCTVHPLDVSATLEPLVQTSLFRDLDRLDAAVACMVTASTPPLP